MQTNFLGFAVSLLVLGGCGTFVETTALNAPPHELSPRPAQEVEVYSSSAPTKAHVDVALLQADQTNASSADLAEMVARIREQAGRMGCDAVLISGASERAGVSGEWHMLDPGSHLLLATCLVYLRPGPAPTATAVAVAPPSPGSAP